MSALVPLPRPGAPLTLTDYERMREAVAVVASADEAKSWADKAASAAFYARQIRDRELETWMTEIKRRAERRLGEMLLSIEPHPGGRQPGSGSSKWASSIRSVVADLGLQRATARDLMQLAGPRDEDLRAVGTAAAEAFYAQARAFRTPATRADLQAHINAAVDAAVGPDEVLRRAKVIRRGQQALKAERRAAREERLGDRTRAASMALGVQRYGVILADPEWKHDTWSEAGMDRAAANHYPTSPLAVIQARDVASIAADHCVLALWATVPMMAEAFCVLDAWGFARFDRDPETGFLVPNKDVARYVSSGAWVKNKPGAGMGMGYWFRVDHEVLLLATRGSPPAPAQGDQARSVFDVPASRVHSEKPELVCEILESYFPTLPKIELNRRGPARPGWDAWGNEAGVAA